MKNQISSLIIVCLTTFSLWSQSASVDSLLLLLKNTSNDTVKVNLYIALGDEFSINHPKKSLQYYNQSLQFAKKSQLPYYLGKSYKSIGNFYYDKSDNEDALFNYKIAQNYFEKEGNEKEHASTLMSIGNVYLNQNSYNQAYEYFIKALRISEKNSNLKGISAAYNNIGLIYHQKKDFIKAIDFYNKSIKIANQINNKTGVSASLTNIGNVYADEKKLNLAKEYYFKSLQIDTALNDKYGMVICFNNIGEIYSDLGLFSKAQEYYRDGLELAQEIGNKTMLSMLHLNISDLKLKTDQLEDAKKHTEIGLKYAKLTDDYKTQGQAYELYSKIAIAQNNYKSAYEYQKLFKNYNDSITEHDRLLKIKSIDVLLDADNKSKEIEELFESKKQNEIKIDNQRFIIFGFVFLLLIISIFTVILFKQNKNKVKMNSLLTLKSIQIEEKNKEILQQHNELETLNITKDRFFSIIGHDLKNPLNSILGFSQLLKENFESYDKEKREKYLEIIKDSAQRANELLENLLNWALTQKNEKKYTPKKIELMKVIQEVCGLHYAQAENKNIKLQANFSQKCWVYADINMVSVILRNLVSNAIKFSNNNSDVSILVNPKEDFCEIIVKDTGVGIAENEIPILFDFQNRNKMEKKKNSGSGLGLILCKDFVEKCGGTIMVKSKVGEGTEIVFTLKTAKNNFQES